MAKRLVLTSCGIINKELKEAFYKLLNKPVDEMKVLYITTAIDGEEISDADWVHNEFQTVLNLGIKEENIKEYNKLDDDIDLSLFDMIYVLGGNTFYLLKKIKDTKFDAKLKEAIHNGILYVGSSAGSIILGNTIELTSVFDKNFVNLTDFTGLKIFDGIFFPHANYEPEFVKEKKEQYQDKIYAVCDGHGIVIHNHKIKEV